MIFRAAFQNISERHARRLNKYCFLTTWHGYGKVVGYRSQVLSRIVAYSARVVLLGRVVNKLLV